MEYNLKNLAKLIDFNRRNFIKLLVGGALGVPLTPLPWKLTDDISIWTQNWPWMPVPPEGEFFHVNSVCRLCRGGCGIRVRKVEDRAVKIEGRTDYPINPGGLCPLGEGGLQLLYNDNIRNPGPMKRYGARGSGQYEPISWDDALKELTDRVKDLRRQKNPGALAAVDGNHPRSSMAHLIERFLEAVGSPNYFRVPSMEDTYAMVNRLMEGTRGPMAYDLENADFVLSFGCGLIEGWGAPGRVLNAWGLWHSPPLKGKVKIVQIESRASTTASKADQWVAPFPGTEAALALGLAHVIVREGLYDKNFVNNYTHGFLDWSDDGGKKHLGFQTLLLEYYSPGRVADITGLHADEIVSLGKAFARSKAPIALCGKGKGTLNGSLFECMAVQSLNALVGNINKPGGVIVPGPLPLSPWPAVTPDPIAAEGLKHSGLDMAGSARSPLSRSLINDLTEAINESDRSPVDTLLIFSANPAFTLPDAGAFREALKKVPYIVSFSPYNDETALLADLILPDHTYLEKTDDVVWPTGLQYPFYALSQPVIEPLKDTRHSGDVIIKLAGMIDKTVGGAFPWKNYEDALKARAMGLFEAKGGLIHYDESSPAWKDLANGGPAKPDYGSFEDMWQSLKTGGFWYRPSHNFGNWGAIFKTPTGKFEFFSSEIRQTVNNLPEVSSTKPALKRLGIEKMGDEAFMPHYEAPPPPANKEHYPLRMMPYELISLASNWLSSPPYLYKTLPDDLLMKENAFIELNPKTAAQQGLVQGDLVSIQSQLGAFTARVNLFEGAMPGVVFAPRGFGHTAYDAYQQKKGGNPNEIIVPGKDPLSGQIMWWNTRVRLLRL